MPVSPSLVWRFIRWFHRPARHIMVATPSLRQELADQGLEQTMLWERGVEHALFRPDRAPHPAFADLPRPIQLYETGRATSELQSLMHISYAVLWLKKTQKHT